MICRVAAVLLLAAGLFLPRASHADQRVALVIGNSAYDQAPLRNPVNDARAMAAVLREVDFDVTLIENADRHALQRAALDFGSKLTADSVGLFYFAGHGMQVRGVNYLIPIGTKVASEDEVEVEAVDVNYVLARMATAKNRFNIVILDACRNNPFERMFRSGNTGLAAISAPRGTLIAYATAPGSLAADGAGANGLYTGQLVAALKTPNLTLEQTFKRTRAEVVTLSSGRQTPWESSSVIGDFVFRPGMAVPAVDPTDQALWNAVKDSARPSDYQAYLDAHPKGVFASLATERIKALNDTRQAEFDRAAREAADRAARAELTRLQAEEAKKAPLAPTQPSQPGTVMSAAYVKENWTTITAVIRKHYFDQANDNFYVPDRLPMPRRDRQLDGIQLQQIDPQPGGGVSIVVALLGNSTSFGAIPYGFTIYTKYDLALRDGQPVIASYSKINNNNSVQREEDTAARFGRVQ